MKKNTMKRLAELVATMPEYASEYEELREELAKSEAKANANRALYATTKEVVLNTLREIAKPVTIAELWEEVKGIVPEGMTKSKIQYALRELWGTEIRVTEGKVNTYEIA